MLALHLPIFTADAGGPLLFLVVGTFFALIAIPAFLITAWLTELVLMHVALGVDYNRSIVVTFIANVISTIAGVALLVIFLTFALWTDSDIPPFWGMWGTAFLVSALIEAPVWVKGVRNHTRAPSWEIVLTCFLANLAGYILATAVIYILFP